MTTSYVKTAAGNLYAFDAATGWILIPVALTRRQRIRRAWLRFITHA